MFLLFTIVKWLKRYINIGECIIKSMSNPNGLTAKVIALATAASIFASTSAFAQTPQPNAPEFSTLSVSQYLARKFPHSRITFETERVQYTTLRPPQYDDPSIVCGKEMRLPEGTIAVVDYHSESVDKDLISCRGTAIIKKYSIHQVTP